MKYTLTNQNSSHLLTYHELKPLTLYRIQPINHWAYNGCVLTLSREMNTIQKSVLFFKGTIMYIDWSNCKDPIFEILPKDYKLSIYQSEWASV